MYVENGMSGAELPDLQWLRSRYSNASGDCVEMARLPNGLGIAIRNSRDPSGPILVYTRDEIRALIRGAVDGDFDDLAA